MPVAAIEIRNLVKQFGANRAVDHLNLRVEQREIFGLLGPNGSGKTTTINMISGLSVPSSGTVHVLGLDVQYQARQVRQLLGCVPQETALFEELTAEHNMRYHAALYGVPRRERNRRIEEMLHLVQLAEKRDELVRTFSGGMKRRLALARALLHAPRVLYLDEPTLGVDVQNRRVLYDFIRGLPQQGVTVLLTTNDMHEAEQLCTRVAILDHGKLQAIDTPRHLIKEKTVIAIRLNRTADSSLLASISILPGVKEVNDEAGHLLITLEEGQELDTLLKHISASGRTIQAIETRQEELETVFLRVTGQLLRD